MQIDPNASWLPFRDVFLDEFLRHDGFADHEKRCTTCERSGDHILYKCTQCFGPMIHCKDCLVSSHSRLPLHKILVCLFYGYSASSFTYARSQKWNGTFWEHCSLFDLGLKVQLGHNGGPCAFPMSQQRPIVVVHTNGIHKVNVAFCECGKPEGGYFCNIQMLRSSWFPTSGIQPRTAFTFECLEHFHHLTLQGKTTAWDYYNAIVHETDNTGLNPPPVRVSPSFDKSLVSLIPTEAIQ